MTVNIFFYYILNLKPRAKHSQGWFAVRCELRAPMLIFLILSMLYLGGWGVMFVSTTFRWTFITWTFFSLMATASVILTLLSAILGIVCLLNFGKGLARHREFFGYVALKRTQSQYSQCPSRIGRRYTLCFWRLRWYRKGCVPTIWVCSYLHRWHQTYILDAIYSLWVSNHIYRTLGDFPRSGTTAQHDWCSSSSTQQLREH